MEKAGGNEVYANKVCQWVKKEGSENIKKLWKNK